MPVSDPLCARVTAAAQCAWWAGLGTVAISRRGLSGVVDGVAHLWGVLVDQGRDIQRARAEAVPGPSPVDALRDAALQTWSAVGTTIGTRITVVSNQLGIPTTEEIADVNRRIERLTASLEALKHSR